MRTALVLFLALTICRATPVWAGGEELREEAKAHYQLGKAAFGRDQFREALAEFERSFAITPVPELLFNMGKCHEAMSEPLLAARDYERFLAVMPSYDDRAALEAHVAALRANAPPSAKVVETPALSLAPRPDDEGARRRRRRRALAIGLGVTGGLLVVGAVTIGVVLGTARVTPYLGNVSPGSQAINP